MEIAVLSKHQFWGKMWDVGAELLMKQLLFHCNLDFSMFRKTAAFDFS